MKVIRFILLCISPFLGIFNCYSSTGLLCNNSDLGKDNILTILNSDNSIYLEFSLLGDINPKLPETFNPYAIDIPNDILLIEVIREDKDRYQVSIGNGQSKFISKSENSLKYYSWTNFILNYDYNSIIVDKKKNPVRVLPTEKSKKVLYIDYDTYTIYGKKIVGDWLKVEVQDIQSIENFKTYGWVKWKNKEKLLIEFRLYD